MPRRIKSVEELTNDVSSLSENNLQWLQRNMVPTLLDGAGLSRGTVDSIYDPILPDSVRSIRPIDFIINICNKAHDNALIHNPRRLNRLTVLKNSIYASLSLREIRWLNQNCTDSFLKALGFTDNQILDIRSSSSIGVTSVPSILSETLSFIKREYLTDLDSQSTSVRGHEPNTTISTSPPIRANNPLFSINDILSFQPTDSQESSNHAPTEVEQYVPPITPIRARLRPTHTSDNQGHIETPSDFSVKYEGCYAALNDKVVYMTSFFSEDGIKSIYRNITANGSISSRESSCNIELLDLTLPKIGMINSKLGVVFVERNHNKSSPSRYRKGIRSDTMTYIPISDLELSKIDHNYYPLTAYSQDDAFRKIAYNILFPTNYSYEEALDKVVSFKLLSASFSSSMAIRLDSITNKIVLHKNLWEIGEYDIKDNIFRMYINDFNEELDSLNIPYTQRG